MSHTTKNPCATCKWYISSDWLDPFDTCSYGTRIPSDIYGSVWKLEYANIPIEQARCRCQGQHYRRSIINTLIYSVGNLFTGEGRW